MARKYMFKYNNRGYDQELVLPVTPSNFTITCGIKTEVVNLTEVGDLNLPGTESAESITLDVLFPIQKYPFVTGPHNPDPYVFTEAFARWSREHFPSRFIVSESNVNIRVYIESIRYGTKSGDGTGDVYATITMRPWRELAAPQVSKEPTGGNNARPGSAPKNPQAYKVVSGDTLWGICRKFYSQPTLCWKLAKYNGIKNANLIYPGQVLKIPDKKELG